jgi:hypothetical protein
MKRSLTILLTLIAILAMAVPGSARMITEGDVAVPAGASGKVAASGVYIVQMADAPVVAYAGGIRGYRATALDGQKLNPDNADVRKYAAYLDGRHQVNP